MGDKNDCPNIMYKSTPPPTNRKVRNPFDKVLIDKLHKPICRLVTYAFDFFTFFFQCMSVDV